MSRNSHIPELAHGVVEVIGEAVVDTELRNLKDFSPDFMIDNFTANEEGKVCWYRHPSDPEGSKVIVRVEKTGTNDGTLGTNPVNVSWTAIGE